MISDAFNTESQIANADVGPGHSPSFGPGHSPSFGPGHSPCFGPGH